jgi:hypothetical protein
LTRHGRPHRIGQQVPHVASLLAARRHDGENPLHEATAVRTLSAETLFAPDHGRAEHAFGGVVGRRNPRMGHNRPERIPPGQHLLAEGRDVVPRSGASVFQGRADGRLDRLHRCLQPSPRGGAVAEGVLGDEHGFDGGQQVARPWAVAHAALRQRPEVARQMRPAELALHGGIAVVRVPAVGADDPVKRRGQERIQAGASATGRDAETGDLVRGRRPEPAALTGFAPTGRIDMHDRRRVDGGVDGGSERGQRLTHPLRAGHHAAEADGQIGPIGEQVANRPIAEVIRSVQMADQCGHAWAVASASLRRQRGRHAGGAGRAADRVLDIVGHDRGDRWQVPHLGRLRRGRIRQGWGEGRRALRAGGGMEWDDGVRLAPCAGGAGMIWLTATRAPARRFRRARWGAGRIGGGRFGRVLAGLGQTLFEFLHAHGERGDLLDQRRDQHASRKRPRVPHVGGNAIWWRQWVVHSTSIP